MASFPGCWGACGGRREAWMRLGAPPGSTAAATRGSWAAQSEALARPALRPRPRQAPRFRTEAPPFGIPLTPPSALAPSQGFPGPDSLLR